MKFGQSRAGSFVAVRGGCAPGASFTLLAPFTGSTGSREGGHGADRWDDIGGVVASAKGPEAGVWVIAETTDLPTKFAKMVVTDDQGRYLLPDLPQAATRSSCGLRVGRFGPRTCQARPAPRSKAVVAPDGLCGAQVYPANYC